MVKRHPHKRQFRFGSERLDEVAAVLEISPEATDTEICESINRWWSRRGNDDPQLQPIDVTEIRLQLGIRQTSRKPFQKRLFGVE